MSRNFARLAFAAMAAGAVAASRHRQPAMLSSPLDCDVPACHSKVDMFKSSLAAAAGKRPAVANPSAPDREDIGRAGWTILHTFAAYYPEHPTEQDQIMAKQFLLAFARFYPCKECGMHLQSVLEEYPAKLDSRTNFSLYICETHNRVNELLDKPEVRCDIAALDLAWRGGYPK